MKRLNVAITVLFVLACAAYVAWHVHRGTWGERVGPEEVQALRAEYEEVVTAIEGLPAEGNRHVTSAQLNAMMALVSVDQLGWRLAEGKYREAFERITGEKFDA